MSGMMPGVALKAGGCVTVGYYWVVVITVSKTSHAFGLGKDPRSRRQPEWQAVELICFVFPLETEEFSVLLSHGYEVGQHPLVSRTLKGIFHERPPQPRYSETWNVAAVTTYIESLGENDSLSLAILTHKLVMLLALTRPSR